MLFTDGQRHRLVARAIDGRFESPSPRDHEKLASKLASNSETKFPPKLDLLVIIKKKVARREGFASSLRLRRLRDA